MNIQDYDAALRKTKFTCIYCGFKANTFDQWCLLSVDHIIPVSCGGSDDVDNVVCSCLYCNSSTSSYKPTDIERHDRMKAIEEKRRLALASKKSILNRWVMAQVQE